MTIALVCGQSACSYTVWRSQLVQPTEISQVAAKAPFVKVHGHGGELHVLRDWRFDAAVGHIRGTGVQMTADRHEAGRGNFAIPIREIALVETLVPNTVRSPKTTFSLVALSAVSVALFVGCMVAEDGCSGR